MLSGRSVTKAEARWHYDLTDICGCVCCVLDGRLRDYRQQPYASIHHCDGRTKPHAHWFVLPLCAGHHQKGTGQLRSMLAIHGDSAAWIASYGRPIEVLEACVMMLERAGRHIPEPVRRLLEKWYASPQYQMQHNALACA